MANPFAPDASVPVPSVTPTPPPVVSGSGPPVSAPDPYLPPTPTASSGPLEQISSTLFGQDNGSVLGGVPVLGQAGRMLGDVSKQVIGGTGVPQAIGAAGFVLSHTPVPDQLTGVNEQFQQLGNSLQQTNPDAYQQWVAVDAAANANSFDGNNQKSNFTRDYMEQQAQSSYEGVTGYLSTAPRLAFGPSGSLGGILADAMGLWGAAGQHIQAAIGGVGQESGGDRLGGLATMAAEANTPGSTGSKYEFTQPELRALQNFSDGTWSRSHAEDFLVASGEGLTHNPVAGLALGAVLDPTVIASFGAGGLIKLGKLGADVAVAANRTEQVARTVYEIQNASLPVKAAFKTARFLVDPLGVVPHGADKSVVDLSGEAASVAMGRAYSPQVVSDAYKLAEAGGFTDEMRSAAGAYAANGARRYAIADFVYSQLKTNGGEAIWDKNPDSIIDHLVATAPQDAVTRATDYFEKTKNPVLADFNKEQLASRMTSSFGRSVPEMAASVEKMSSNELSWWHAVTYSKADKDFEAMKSLLTSADWASTTIDPARLVLLNDDTLDNVLAQSIRNKLDAVDKSVDEGVAAAAKGLPKGKIKAAKDAALQAGMDASISQKVAIWKEASRKYPGIADLGKADFNHESMQALKDNLDKLIKSGRLHARVTGDELKDFPTVARDFLTNKHPEWNYGFAPKSSDAMGLSRNAQGKLYAEWQPFVSHTYDTAPFYRPVADVTRNYLGMIIGDKAASLATKPIDAMEIFSRTALDQVSGMRMVENMRQRFSSVASTAGVGSADSRKMWDSIQEAASINDTTVNAMEPKNLWKALTDAQQFQLKEAKWGENELMHAILTASEGDLRLVGLTSKFSSRARTIMDARGVPPGNFAGRLTVGFYRTVRYNLNPTFLIQRTSDMAYFNALRGIMPIGSGVLTGELARTARIMKALGNTGMSRDLSMDMHEYQQLSQFQEELRNEFGKVDRVAIRQTRHWAGRNIFNNRVAATYKAMGPAVETAITNAAKAFPTNELVENAARMRTHWSDMAGHALNDSEFGLRYLEEIFHDSLDNVITNDGLLDYSRSITKGTYHKPVDLGENRPLDLNYLVHQGQWSDIHSIDELRSAVRPAKNGKPGGPRSLGWLRSEMVDKMKIDPDHANRVINYLDFDHREFWNDMSVKLDMNPAESKQMQAWVASVAKSRGMDPAEYISQGMMTNLSGADLQTEMGKAFEVLQAANKGTVPSVKALARVLMSHLDPSTGGKGGTLLAHLRDVELPERIAQAERSGNPNQAKVLQGHLDNLTAAPPKLDLTDPAVHQQVFPGKKFWSPLVESDGMFDATPGRNHMSDMSVLDVPKVGAPGAPGRDDILRFLAQTRQDFPDLNLDNVRLGDLIKDYGSSATKRGDSAAMTSPWKGRSGIILEKSMWDGSPKAARLWKSWMAHQHGGEIVDATPLGAVYHEQSHVIDEMLKDTNKPYFAFRNRLMEGTPTDVFFSEYGRTHGLDEMMAELHTAAFSPNVDLKDIAFKTQIPINELEERIAEYKGILQDAGVYKPGVGPESLQTYKTVAGAPAFSSKADAFGEAVLNRLKTGVPDANHDVERTYRYFSKFVTDHFSSILEKSPTKVGAHLRDIMASVPSAGGTPFNEGQAMLEHLLTQNMRLAEKDIIRLAHAQTERTVLERSLNHPIFGLYPSSYMWGKVLPEMFRFIVKRPFGIQTGGMVNAIANLQQHLAAMREWDPAFQKAIDNIGNSAVMFALGYMTPSLPWEDMQAAAPPWVRSIGKNGFDIGAMTKAELDTINPARWFSIIAKGANEGVKDLQHLFSPQQEQQLQNITTPEPQTAPPSGPADLSSPVPATGLQPVLQDDMTKLQDLLSQ